MKTFSILYHHAMEKELKKEGRTILRSIPWEMIQDHERQAQYNHSQSLDRLNSRGGLDPVEMYAVINDLKWRDVKLTPRACLAWIEDQVSKYKDKS